MKIRGNEDKEQLNKINEISSKVTKLGMSLKKKSITTAKPVGDIVTSSAKWTTPSNKISEKRISNTKTDDTPKTPLLPKE